MKGSGSTAEITAAAIAAAASVGGKGIEEKLKAFTPTFPDGWNKEIIY